MKKKQHNNSKRWTREEEMRLLDQVKAFPQNLSKCFLIVSEVTGRTPSAVAGHWYTKVSKDPTAICFFTASPQHVSRNRKNGAGVVSNRSIWSRLLNIIRSI